MSWKSEHLNLKPLPNGKSRSGIRVEDVPKRNKQNDVKMRVRRKNYYGNTRFGDDQIVYFYLKHNGNCAKASKDLGYRNSYSFTVRASKIVYDGKPLRAAPIKTRKRKFTNEELLVAMDLSNNNTREAASLLKVTRETVLNRCSECGIKVKRHKVNKQTALTYKESCKLALFVIKHNGNITLAARDAKVQAHYLRNCLARMYVIDVLGIGRYNK